MKAPGIYRWRELLVLGGAALSVLLSWGASLLEPIGSGNHWVLEWFIGGSYAVSVLGPLAWYRSQSWLRIVAGGIISVLAWHWAVNIASDRYSSIGESGTERFLLRSAFSGFFGAILVAAAPLARSIYPGWERRVACIGLVGGFCGGQMGVLCLWNFGWGFWLGMLGWQLAVTLLLIHGTAPHRDGRPNFWPAPPQLR